MKTNPVAAGMAFGVFWALGVGGITVIALLFGTVSGGVYSGYGAELVKLLMSIYPGYSISLAGCAVGVLWALADGFVSAAVIVWLYNFFCCLLSAEKKVKKYVSHPGKMHVRM